MDLMKSVWPFNVVDLFAYLGQGFALIVVFQGLARTYEPALLSQAELLTGDLLDNVIVSAALLIVASYTIGQLLAHLSYPLFERLLVGRFFGTAASNALGQVQDGTRRRWILRLLGVPEYARPVSDVFRKRITDAYAVYADDTGFAADHYATRVCFTAVQENCPATRLRIETFLGLYSFARNSSFTLALLGVVTVAVAGFQELPFAMALLLAALVLFGRYLKFLRLYVDEIWLGFDYFTRKPMRRRPVPRSASDA